MRSGMGSQDIDAAMAIADGCFDGDSGTVAGQNGVLGPVACLARLFAQRREAFTSHPCNWGHLEVGEPIGSGGFGTVYRAFDPVLQREVALKLRNADEAGPDEAFITEARRLARVQHPNVLAIHGADVRDGLVGLWADLLQGRTLEQRLAAGERFDEGRVLRIASALADALRAVHASGLIHGDVKAGNVMVDDAGKVTLMDFGAAHRSHGGRPKYGSPLSMAPEVLAGHEGSPAADVYALGVLLYRLVTGEYPFEAPDRQALLARKRAGNVDAERLGAVSKPLRRLVLRMLDPEPGNRPTIDEAVEVLRWIEQSPTRRLRLRAVAAVAGSAVLAALALAFAYIGQDGRSAGAVPAFEASMAVMPFDNIGADPERDYFARGLSETILHRLSEVEGLKVAGRYSSFDAAPAGDPKKLANELGVDNVLHGSVQRDGRRLRVFAELVRAADGTQLWSQTFDRRMDDVFRIQDSIAAEVAAALRGGAIDRSRSRARQTDVDTYEIYLRGLSLLNRRGADNLLRAIEYFRDVVDRDPGFALAWSGLASAYRVLPSYMDAPAESGERATEAAQKAIELDPDDGLALGVLSTNHTARREWLQADRMFQRALAAEPSNSNLHMWYGELMAETGRLEAKLEQMALAVELDPLAPAQRGNYGWALLANHDFERAARECRTAWDMGLEALFVWWCAFDAILFQGRFDAAERWIEQMPRGEAARRRARLFVAAYRDPGARDTRARSVSALTAAYRAGGMPPANVAMYLLMLGEIELAWPIVDESVDAGEYELTRSLFGPHMDLLHADPRFVELMQRLGMVEYWRATEWGPICRPVDGGVACGPA